jgi:hypothetical protein
MITAMLGEHWREHWPRWLLGAAITAHLLMMGSLFWGYLDSLFATGPAQQGIDFFSIYEAGHRALENRPIYTLDQSEPSAVPYFLAFRYVPLFAYAFAVPMNALPPWSAYWAWVSFVELLLVVNAYATWRIAGRGRWGLVAASMWFAFTPFYLEQKLGQFSFAMATLALWAGFGIERGREAISGWAWALSVNIKSNTGLLGPVFVRLGWWRSIAGTAALAALNAPYFLFRRGEFEFFYTSNFKMLVDSGGRFFAYNAELEGLPALARNTVLALDKSASGVPSAVPLTIIAIIISIGLVATFVPRVNDALIAFALWLCAYFLIYEPWEHHYVLFLPAATLLVALRPEMRIWTLAAFVLVAIPTPYWLMNNVWNTGPVPEYGSLTTIQDAWPDWGVVLYHAAKPVPVLAIWCYLVARQLRAGLDPSWALSMWSRARAFVRRAA